MATRKERPRIHFNVAEHLKTRREITGFLKACFESAGGDAGYIAEALGAVTRAQGMAEIAKELGISRTSLYRSLSKKGNPELSTLLKLLDLLDLKLSVKSKHP